MSKRKRRAKGTGSFIKQNDGTILHRKSVGYTDKGTRKVLTVRGPTEAACVKLMKEKEKKWQKDCESKGFDASMTVSELCYTHLKSEIDSLQSKSIDRREVTIHNQIDGYNIGHYQVETVTSDDVNRHVSEMIENGLSASTIKKAVDVINAAYNWAIDKRALSYNPIGGVKKNIMKRINALNYSLEDDADVVILSDDEIEAVEKTFSDPKVVGVKSYHSALYGLFLLHTGLRCGELFALKWEDISKDGILSVRKSRTIVKNRKEKDPEVAYVSIEKSTKNQKARKIQLTDAAIEDLDKIRKIRGVFELGDLICITGSGNHNTASNLEHQMKRLYRLAGLDINTGSLHILRRTFATRLYRKTKDVKLVAAYIGDLESTVMKYYIAAREKVISTDGSVQQVIRIHED